MTALFVGPVWTEVTEANSAASQSAAEELVWPEVSVEHVRRVWINLYEWSQENGIAFAQIQSGELPSQKSLVNDPLNAVKRAKLSFTQALMENPGGVPVLWSEGQLFATALTCDVLLGQALLEQGGASLEEGDLDDGGKAVALGATFQKIEQVRSGRNLLRGQRAELSACIRSMWLYIEQHSDMEGFAGLANEMRAALSPLSGAADDDRPQEPLFLRVLDARDFVGQALYPRRTVQNWIGPSPASVFLDTLSGELSIEFASSDMPSIKVDSGQFLELGILPTAFSQLAPDRFLVAGINPYTLSGCLAQLDLDLVTGGVLEFNWIETWSSFVVATALEMLPGRNGVAILDGFTGVVVVLEQGRRPSLVVHHSQDDRVLLARALSVQLVPASAGLEPGLEISLLRDPAAKEAVGLFGSSSVLLKAIARGDQRVFEVLPD